MIKKLKIGLSAVALSLLVVAATANAAALTWSANQTVDLSSPDVNLIIKSGSEATSLVVGAGSITVVVPSGDTFTVTSASSPLNVTGDSTSGIANTCTSGVATVVISGDAETITIAPTGIVACDEGGGGGGGGGSSSNNDDDEVTPGTTVEGCAAGNLFSTTTGQSCGGAVVGCGAGNAFSPITGQSCGGTVTNTVIITTPGAAGNFGYAFGTTLVKQGTTGEACKAWQTFFNVHANAGLVTDGICGPKTMAAAVAWQASQGLVADGLLGPASRAKANAQASNQQ